MLVQQFKKQFTCLGENTEKYITCTAPIEKEVTRIDKNGEEIINNLYLAYYNLILKLAELNISNVNIFLNTQILKMI